MNKRLNKYMSMAAVFAISSVMISCSSNDTQKIPEDKTDTSVSSAEENIMDVEKTNGISYKFTQKQLPDELNTVTGLKPASDGALIFGVDSERKPLLYLANAEYESFTVLSDGSYNAGDYVYGAQSPDKTTCVLVVSADYPGLPEPDYNDPDLDWGEYEEAAVYTMRLDTYNPDGHLINSAEIPDSSKYFEESSVCGFESLGDNRNAVIFYGGRVLVVDNSGSIANEAELETNAYCTTVDSSGNLVLCDDVTVASFNPDTLMPESNDTLNSDTNQVYINNAVAGTQDYRLYLSLYDGIYGMKENTRKLYKIIDFVNTGISQERAQFIHPMSDNRFAVMGNVQDSSGDGCYPALYILTERTEDEIKETKVIKMASMASEISLDAINDFNNSNDGGYRIEVMDDYGGREKGDAEENFYMSIVAGEEPDFACFFDYSSMENFAAKGIFADMYPFIDNDPELSREDFLSNYLEVNETGGKLTMLPDSFFVHTILAKTDNLNGIGENWTVDDMIKLGGSLDENQVLFYSASNPEASLQQLLFHTVSNYIDYENRTCRFNSPEFIKLLEFVNNMNYDVMGLGDDVYNLYLNDKAVVYPLSIHDENEYEIVKESAFGNKDLTFLGYPSEDGTGGLFHFVGNNFAIMESSENKDGAWAFIREFFLDGYQNGIRRREYGFPVIKKCLESADETLVNYISNIKKAGSFDYDIYGIVEEEAAYYFAGEHTAQEAADIIQNRVSILISEQY